MDRSGSLGHESEAWLQDFAPIALDVTPLQKLLFKLMHQIEQCQKDNQSLRDELNQLKVGKRLDTLESGLQSVAEEVQEVRTTCARPEETAASQHDKGGNGGGGGGDGASGWEVTQLKERMTQIERRSEALWHAREGDEELRVAVERLQTDHKALISEHQATSSGLGAVRQDLARVDTAGTTSSATISELQAKLGTLSEHQTRLVQERDDAALKVESTTSALWDQLRHVEAALNQRLTLAESSQVSAMQEVDEVKESANDVTNRCEDLKRLIAAVESKLESFNTQVAGAISPLHTSLATATLRIEDLQSTKLDAAAAVTMSDVEQAAVRAITAGEQRAVLIMKAMGGVEQRVDALANRMADKADVVFHADMAASLAAHTNELTDKMTLLGTSFMAELATKIDGDALAAQDARLAARISALEGAILKGLKAISDKVSVALAEKTDVARFHEFKIQVRAALVDMEDRFREWSPTSRALRSRADGTTSTCLCCESRVKSAQDLKMSGFGHDDRVFVPEKLPSVGPWHSSTGRSQPDVHAFSNARVSLRRKELATMLSSKANTIPEPFPNSTSPREVYATAVVDVAGKLQLPRSESHSRGGGRIRIDVETVSGQIAKGQLPSRGKQPDSARLSGTKTPELSGWETPNSFGQAALPDSPIEA